MNLSKDEIRFFRAQISTLRAKAQREREEKELAEHLAELWEYENSQEDDACPLTMRSRYNVDPR